MTSYSISASLWNEKKEGKMYIFLVNLIVERQNIKKTLYKLPVPIFNFYYKKDLLASFPTPSAPLATKTTTPLVKAICSTTEIEWRHKMLHLLSYEDLHRTSYEYLVADCDTYRLCQKSGPSPRPRRLPSCSFRCGWIWPRKRGEMWRPLSK